MQFASVDYPKQIDFTLSEDHPYTAKVPEMKAKLL